MSTYLYIAETILRAARRPLSARAILRDAYLTGIVPKELYGKSQHKTLQARLSEDILHRREHSRFFRTKPGKFFLRQFLVDSSVPNDYRQEMTARRRTRDLLRGPALSVNIKEIINAMGAQEFANAAGVLETMRTGGWYDYVDPRAVANDQTLLWAVSAVTKNKKVLSYRAGRYRDDRDTFAQKRTIGFSTLVMETDRTLFDTLSFGIADSGLFAVATDLNIPLVEAASAADSFQHSVKFLAWCHETPRPEILAFVQVQAPEWFEPSVNKLSLNDMMWLDLTVRPNNIDDFDPWSKTLLTSYFDLEKMYA